ncbi:MAG: YfhO family protein [bacterium]
MVIALGNNTPLYRFIYPISFFSHSRVPAKILFLTTFAAALLAGIGFDSLADLADRIRLQKISKVWYRELVIFFGIGLVLIGIIIYTQPGIRYQLLQGIVGRNFLNTHLLWQSGLFILMLLFFIYGLFSNRISIKTMQISILFLIIIDLFWFSSIIKQDLNRPVNWHLGLDKPAAVRIIQRDQATDYRVYSLSNQICEGYDDIYDSVSLLTRLSGLYYHMPTFQLYGPAHILRYYELLGDIEAPWNKMKPQERAQKLYQKLTILSMANVKYIITKIPLSNNRLELVHNGDVKVYRLKNNLPKAFFVTQAKSLDNKSDILAYLNQPEFNPTQIVVLEKYTPFGKPMENSPANTQAEVLIQQEALHRIIIDTYTINTGFLFLSKYYYPGWRADIDGKEIPIYQANYLFSAIALPVGKHTVTFTFRPISFYLGLTITLITFLILIAYLGIAIRKKLQ